MLKSHPERQIRANYNNSTIRIYQAYSDSIADNALLNGTFISPPFKMTRMTWIKPSFLWMMYRAGWGKKDSGQKRILAIDIKHSGFNWALENSCLSHFSEKIHLSHEDWRAQLENSHVRIQWDPERDIYLQRLDYRSLQVGLSGEAVERYVNDWIVNITEITPLAEQIRTLIQSKQFEQAIALLPKESPYTVKQHLSPKAASTLQI